MTSLCVDTRGALRRQDLLFADYLNGLGEIPGSEVCRLVRGNVAKDNEMVCRWEPGGLGNRWWEPRFLESGEFDCFHCFRPLDQVPWQAPRALVTVLAGKAPRRIPSTQLCRLVVPSDADRTHLLLSYDIEPDHVSVLTPAHRRAFASSTPRPKSGEKGVLFITGSGGTQEKKLLSLLKRQHHRLAQFEISLTQTKPFPIEEWEKMLSQVQLAFYLVSDPFDWGTLALECAARDVPVIHSDENRFLSEYWNEPRLGLRNYLLEHPTPKDVAGHLKRAEKAAPIRQDLTKYFAELYREAPVSLPPDLQPSPSASVGGNPLDGPKGPGAGTTDYSQ